MLVLTTNQYLKLGMIKLAVEDDSCIELKQKKTNRKVVLFDTGESLYIWGGATSLERCLSDFFFMLISSQRIQKEELRTSEISSIISRRFENSCAKSDSIKNSTKLTECERIVVNLLCQEKSSSEISQKLNLSIKRISIMKKKALIKLGMRNMQMLHRTFVCWVRVKTEMTKTH